MNETIQTLMPDYEAYKLLSIYETKCKICNTKATDPVEAFEILNGNCINCQLNYEKYSMMQDHEVVDYPDYTTSDNFVWDSEMTGVYNDNN